VQKLLESQPARKKDRAGELALGNSFLGLPGRGVVSRGAGPAQKPGGGLQKRNFISMRVILFAFFLRVFYAFFLCIFFAFPRPGLPPSPLA